MIKKIIFVSSAFFVMSLLALLKANPAMGNGEDNHMPEGHAVGSSSVVLELFTSQGCSSCPSADALLWKVKQEFPDDVFALSYHVDYWDYIGWKDPFAKTEHTQKQRAYGKKFRLNSIYTPQMVVNGREHFVGSNRAELYSKIDACRAISVVNTIKIINADVANGTIAFSYDVIGNIEHKLLRVVLVIDERVTQVKRGENRNRTLKNSNIVVQEKHVELKHSSGESSIQIPSVVSKDDGLTLILLVETAGLDITGAAKREISH
ncbi:DUF1223 domain-containing protein [Flagellimonas sediminis]|uniref:DUF1223 domain-containing protein n=1 Tax=Flagellimonas sediminis TaxID=2696468 RepID=A0A6I5KX74_9FLAO|nr:DUF1223 domain-containing protein [Allomuricauda sediminis]NDV42608.1 DUF1223 domain-containing protein [Allomuricauda sediminis]